MPDFDGSRHRAGACAGRPEPPKPVLDHFPHDRRIPDRPDAAEWSRRRQAAAERRRADRHGEQPIVVVNPVPPPRNRSTWRPSARQLARTSTPEMPSAASTALPDLAGQPPTELRAAQRDPRDAIVEREHVVEPSEGDRAFGEIRPQTARRVVDGRDVRARHRVAQRLGKEVSERRSEVAGSTNRRIEGHAERCGLKRMNALRAPAPSPGRSPDRADGFLRTAPAPRFGAGRSSGHGSCRHRSDAVRRAGSARRAWSADRRRRRRGRTPGRARRAG